MTLVGDDVDLYKLPIPMSSIYDGGPMITAGVVIARDPELGMNSGIYRFIVKEKALTGIDIVTPNNMRLFAQRAFERKEPLPISISIGTHPFEITGSGYRAPLGVDEMAIAGGLRGEAVELAPCSTIDMPYIADAEIVLEAEILPTGWTWPEGRFGEFTRLMGGLHWNPLVRIKAISMRKDAIYYNLHMPWENTWLAAPTRYAAIRQALRTANVQVKDINVTLGGCAFWHAVISIKKGAGEGKNALLAALSVMDLKHVVVVDDDIDVNDPTDVEWAIATRVQGDKDVIVIPGARAKPLDPSLPQGAGVVPVGAKVGIDATIPEGIPLEHYERITYAYADTRQGRRLRQGQEGPGRRSRRRARGGEAREGNPRRDREGAALLHRRRGALSKPTTSAPWRARLAICTRPRSCGRTRAARCACGAASSPRCCRHEEGMHADRHPLPRHRDRHQALSAQAAVRQAVRLVGGAPARLSRHGQGQVEAGVDKAILVQASSAYAFDNSYVADSVAAHPERFTGVFSVDVVAPDAVQKMKHWMAKGLTGMRIFTSGSTQPSRRRSSPKQAAFPAWTVRQRPGAVGLHADAREGPAAARDRAQALSQGARHPRPFRARGGSRRPAVRRGRAAVRAVEISQCLSQAHPPADRAVGEGQIHAGGVPRQGGAGIRRQPHDLGLELPGRAAAAAGTDRDGAQRAFLPAATGSGLDFLQDRPGALSGAGEVRE